MAMKKCKECGEEISSSAKVCPKCGKKQKNFTKIFIIIMVLVIIFAVAAGSSDTGTVSETKKNSNNEASQTGNKIVNVGETYNGQGLNISFLSLDDNFQGYHEFADIKDGNKIIRAEFEIENVSDSDKYVGTFGFYCYADGYDCESFIWTDDASFSATLSKGKKAKGACYFEVPANAEEIHLEYETDYWNGTKVEFKIK